jgi:hypothetical protein
MKKTLLYLFLYLILTSCSDNVSFNSPAFEGQKDNVFWRAIDTRAKQAIDGSLIIEGYTKNEKLTLKTVTKNPNTYVLGIDNSNFASYVSTDNNNTLTFSTAANIGEGKIVIENYDAINKTITGTFKFIAKNINNNPLAGPTMHFQYGHFYKIPVTISSSTNTTAIP